MSFDEHQLKLERQKGILAFCSVLKECYAVSTDVDALVAKKDPPASKSTIAAVIAVRNSIPVIPLPLECAKKICDFAFGESLHTYRRRKILDGVREQHRLYSRLPGKIVLHHKAKVGERVRYPHRRWPTGTITSLDCDFGSEVAVRWDDANVTGNDAGGLKCGKKGLYQLVYC